MDLTKITSRASALRALKKLGYTDPGYSMVRGAALRVGHDLTFLVADGDFFVTDKKKHFTYVPALRHIGNTAVNANSQHDWLMSLIVDSGLAPEGVELPIHGLCIALAQLAVFRTEGVIVAVTGPTIEG